MAPFDRRDFSGNSVPTTITSTIGPSDLTINLASSTGWPDGDVGPFIVTIDKNLATEEKIEVASRTGLVLTVTATGRGHDNTAGVGHGAGAPIEHTLSARDLAEANQHIADDTLDHHSQYLTPTRHTAEVHSIDTTEIVDASVTAIKLSADQRHLAGDFKWGIQTADHSGWLLCDGRTVTQAAYPALWTAMGSAHIFGTDPGSASFRLPDLRKKYLAGKAASGVGSTLGGSFGSADAPVISHSHTANDHTHGGTTGDHDRNHTHGMKNHVHWVNGVGNHGHTMNGGVFVYGYRTDAASNGLQVGGVERMTFSAPDQAGGHDHGNTQGPNDNTSDNPNTGHLHPFTTGGASNRGTDLQGVAGTDQNLPPSIAVNGFIHV